MLFAVDINADKNYVNLRGSKQQLGEGTPPDPPRLRGRTSFIKVPTALPGNCKLSEKSRQSTHDLNQAMADPTADL